MKLEFVYHPTHPPVGSRHVSLTCCPPSLLPRVQFVPCMPRAPALTYHPSHPIALHASQTVEDVLIKIYRKMYRNPGFLRRNPNRPILYGDGTLYDGGPAHKQNSFQHSLKNQEKLPLTLIKRKMDKVPREAPLATNVQSLTNI